MKCADERKKPERTAGMLKEASETGGIMAQSEETGKCTQEVSAWDRVQAARSMTRPVSGDYINAVFERFLELHGDRLYGDDRAVIGGIAQIGERYVTVIGEQKGRSTKENKLRNFGMPNPEGYRKALRLMKQAEKFGRPILLFVDTPGAFCGVEAEERGQGEAIARNLFELAGLTVPVLSIIIGEGGSGGALALAMANEVWMLENSVYSILSPEGFAAILWKNGKRAAEAAEVMKMTAVELKKLGVIDKVLAESEELEEVQEQEQAELTGKQKTKNLLPKSQLITTQKERKADTLITADRARMDSLAQRLRAEIEDFLERYEKKSGEEIREERYQKFRRM